MIATPKLHSPIAHPLGIADSKNVPLFGGRRLIDVWDSISNDGGWRGQSMRFAPPLERQRRAVIAKQIRVEGLK